MAKRSLGSQLAEAFGTFSVRPHYRTQPPPDGIEMSTNHTAFAWGAKAARAGLPLSNNPYMNANARRAWAEGYAYDTATRKKHGNVGH